MNATFKLLLSCGGDGEAVGLLVVAGAGGDGIGGGSRWRGGVGLAEETGGFDGMGRVDVLA